FPSTDVELDLQGLQAGKAEQRDGLVEFVFDQYRPAARTNPPDVAHTYGAISAFVREQSWERLELFDVFRSQRAEFGGRGVVGVFQEAGPVEFVGWKVPASFSGGYEQVVHTVLVGEMVKLPRPEPQNGGPELLARPHHIIGGRGGLVEQRRQSEQVGRN